MYDFCSFLSFFLLFLLSSFNVKLSWGTSVGACFFQVFLQLVESSLLTPPPIVLEIIRYVLLIYIYFLSHFYLLALFMYIEKSFSYLSTTSQISHNNSAFSVLVSSHSLHVLYRATSIFVPSQLQLRLILLLSLDVVLVLFVLSPFLKDHTEQKSDALQNVGPVIRTCLRHALPLYLKCTCQWPDSLHSLYAAPQVSDSFWLQETENLTNKGLKHHSIECLISKKTTLSLVSSRIHIYPSVPASWRIGFCPDLCKVAATAPGRRFSHSQIRRQETTEAGSRQPLSFHQGGNFT